VQLKALLRGQGFAAQEAMLTPAPIEGGAAPGERRAAGGASLPHLATTQGALAQHDAAVQAYQGDLTPAVQLTTETVTHSTDTGNAYAAQLNTDTIHNNVSLNLGVAWTKQGTWTNDEAFTAFPTRCEGVVGTYLNSRFKIVGTKAGSPDLELPVSFSATTDTSGHVINCHGGTHGRSSVSASGGNFYELGQDTEASIPDVCIAHEFGHALLGASDEYANPAVPDRALTDDHSIMANFYDQGAAEAEFKTRHVAHLVAPVAAHYPGYICSIVNV